MGANEGDDVFLAIDISHNDEPYLVTVDVATEGESSEEEDDENEPNLVTVNEPNLVTLNAGIDVATEGESSEKENDENEPYPSDYNSEELESFRLEKKREINDQLDNFKELEKGMSFKKLDEAKRVVNYYSIARKVALRVDKSDSVRVRYKCIVGCPFVCLISEVKKGKGFEIKTLQTKHTCPEAFKNRRATQQALAHYFKNRVQNDPNCKMTEMRKIVHDKFKHNISYSKMKRVKRLVLEKLDGSYVDDFNKLEGYAQELRDSNPSTDALKSGWRAGLRPFIGLDDTFLRGKFKGILLVALGQDSMKNVYPLAWAVVDRETIRTWKWFIELLRNSLGLTDGEGLTLMSDMQKGLIGVVSAFFQNYKIDGVQNT
ncbi:uncharacterized protein [Solanum lycopersicum]|uniref:uncharacterized protein n=1 Tax=Solanum lycopersicum TaxID=4081 RepID=UPI0037483187